MSDYICHDILSPILKGFPVKTLLQWRCVCKSWKQLIDSTLFILDHLSIQRPRILLQNKNLEYLLLDPHNRPLYDTLTGPDGVQSSSRVLKKICCNLYAIGSVHGVICLYNNNNLLLFWNPSIRRHLSIPLPEFPPDWADDFKLCGFWIDPSTKDFKVVIFCFIGKVISLFSSRKWAWMEIALDKRELETDFKSPQVLIDGVAYWTAANVHVPYCEHIVCFDFWQDKFGTIDLPKGLKEWPLDVYVSKWRGSLSILHSYLMVNYPRRLDLWAMQNGSWSNMMSFSLIEDIPEALCLLEDWGRVLASTRGGELVLYDCGNEGYIRLCSRKDGYVPLSFKYVEPRKFSFAYDHVESLVFPDKSCISTV